MENHRNFIHPHNRFTLTMISFSIFFPSDFNATSKDERCIVVKTNDINNCDECDEKSVGRNYMYEKWLTIFEM